MDKLFAILLHVTAQMMGYTEPEMPDMRAVTHAELQIFMCGKVQKECHVPTAIYFGHHIFYDQSINLDVEYGKSVIVHEMAHYLQDVNGWGQLDCVNMNSRETQAYLIQYRFLYSRGIDTDIETVMSGWHPKTCPDKEAHQ